MTDLQTLTALGKKTDYQNSYNPDLLVAIPRQACKYPQSGHDIWRAFEVSWIGHDHKPCIRTLVLTYSARSPNIVESKSLKLYLGSLNFTQFTTPSAFLERVKQDISRIVATEVMVTFDDMMTRSTLDGICIDNEPASSTQYTHPDRSALISTNKQVVNEILYTHLFRSCCPVTAQPDWASIQINYSGKQVNRSALLTYLLAYRGHAGFHESCISQIFDDFYQMIEPQELTIKGFFSRRGGIDINPCRSTIHNILVENTYLDRQ